MPTAPTAIRPMPTSLPRAAQSADATATVYTTENNEHYQTTAADGQDTSNHHRNGL